jgi:tetratricopeptide (TPR) repeat protein
MAEWQRLNPTPPADLKFLTVECYFERAFAFKPEDATLYMVYGIFLHKKGDLENARVVYERGVSLKPDYGELLYNLGLVLFDLKLYDDAKARAVAAYDLGYPLPGLKRKLERVGKW